MSPVTQALHMYILIDACICPCIYTYIYTDTDTGPYFQDSSHGEEPHERTHQHGI